MAANSSDGGESGGAGEAVKRGFGMQLASGWSSFAANPRAFVQKCALVLVAGAWMVVSSGLILLNKYLLKDLKFHYPMALSALGMMTSSLAAAVTIFGLKLVEAKRPVSRRMWITHMLPVGLFMALSLQLGNYAYLELTVAFIQMLKALCPVMTLIAMAVARLLLPTLPLCASVVLISLGVVMSSYGEVNMSWIGMSAMLGSEAAEAMRLVITQILLVGCKFHPIEGLLYLAPACSLWLLMGCYVWELPRMQEERAFAIVAAHPWLFATAGFLGFGVNVLSLCVIRLGSGLTLKVLATMKNTILVVISATFLHEVVTGLQYGGYAVTMAGFLWYQAVFVPPDVAAQQASKGEGNYKPLNAREHVRPFAEGFAHLISPSKQTPKQQPIKSQRSLSAKLAPV
mmetsp:Transcript_27077/g.68122  ORF Transcript_27077/g.68122 Transcript_27077/m.68122 type:complete len:400 (+) Transcript_27077:201-1400(+)|eukprot:jgi/Tetstr1/434656/TSEL_023747.t1